MERISNKQGHYYREEFWHGREFMLIAKPIILEGAKIYEVESFDYSEAPFTAKTRCEKKLGKTPQIAFKLMKDEIKKLYKIPKEMQEWLDSDRKFKQRQDYEYKKRNKK